MSDFNVSAVVNSPITYIGVFAIASLLNFGAAVIRDDRSELILTEVRENGKQIAMLNTRVAVLEERIVRLHPEVGGP